MADATRELQILLTAKDEASKPLKSMGGTLSDTKKLLVGLGGAIATIKVKQFAEDVIDAAAGFEQYRVAFGTLVGDSQKGKKLLDDLFTFATKTPFDLPDVVEGSKKLLALGTTAENIIPTFTMLGEIAAGVGKDKLPQLILAFGQIQAKGKLMGGELRQLQEAGVNVAEGLGMTSGELEALVSKGKIGFEDVKKALEALTEEGGRFHGLMQAQAETTQGKITNMADAWLRVKIAIGDSLLPVVNQLLTVLLPMIEAFGKFAQDNPQLVAGLLLVVGVLSAITAVASFLAPVFMTLVAVLGTVAANFGFIVAGAGAVVAFLGGPLTLAILAIIALAVGLYQAWKNNWLGIRDIIDQMAKFFGEQFGKMAAAVGGVINQIKGLISAAQDMAGKVAKGLKIPGFQHGGFVDGSSSQAVPAILHGGERVIPRNGTDVNTSGGGGGVTINISGSFTLDESGRIQELADRIARTLGRQNELAAKGVSF